MRDKLDARISRRSFLSASTVTLSTVALTLAGCAGLPPSTGRFRGGRYRPPIAIATWDHGVAATEEAFRTLASDGHPLDAVERGINVSEEDPAVDSVGVGGLPNADGVVQLDAAIMDGERLRCGSVLSLEGISRPISVARRVMEKTRHIQLAQRGALEFALAEGFETRELLTPEARRAWESWKTRSAEGNDGSPRRGAADHDTIGMVVLDDQGRMAAGCSTSGLAWKLSGRVGDSPIIGAGLYCDARVGGASATGVGEEVLRVCGSLLVVEAMRRGASPQEAVEMALRRILEVDRANRELQVAFVALSRRGEVGAASIQPGFQVAIRATEGALLLNAHVV